MKRYIQFIIYSTTVLIAKLCTDFIIKLILPYVKTTSNPHYDVLIGMLLIVLLFFPLYGLIHKFMEKVMKGYVRKSKNFHKVNWIGITLGYLLVLFIIFGLFMKVKFDINIIEEAYEYSIQSLG